MIDDRWHLDDEERRRAIATCELEQPLGTISKRDIGETRCDG